LNLDNLRKRKTTGNKLRSKETKVFIFGGDFILPPLIRILEGATMEKLSQIISGIIFGAISWIVLYQYFFIGG
jgi:hypothetical protein